MYGHLNILRYVLSKNKFTYPYFCQATRVFLQKKAVEPIVMLINKYQIGFRQLRN